MEEKLQRRFSRDRIARAGLPSLTLETVECRQSSCRLEISWAEADAAAAGKTPEAVNFAPDPLGHFESKTARLGTVSERQPPAPGETTLPNGYQVRVRRDGRLAVTEVVLFSGAAMDPSTP
jgi:hypothetical protein